MVIARIGGEMGDRGQAREGGECSRTLHYTKVKYCTTLQGSEVYPGKVKCSVVQGRAGQYPIVWCTLETLLACLLTLLCRCMHYALHSMQCSAVQCRTEDVGLRGRGLPGCINSYCPGNNPVHQLPTDKNH